MIGIRISQRRSRLVFAMVMLLTLFATHALAQGYPSKPIKIIVPFPPGGPTDINARLIGQKLSEAWGQPVIIENRPGATGLIGSNVVRQSAPDGYTLLFTSNSSHVIGPLLHKPRSFDPVNDFTPIVMVLRYPIYLLINPSIPATTLSEFVALAKAKPGQLNFASVGNGSLGHVGCEMFNSAAGISTTHVPYKGSAPAQMAVISGEAHFFCDSVGYSQQHVLAGKLRGLALTSAKRSPAAPEVPTMTEAGVPGLESMQIWHGFLAPPKLPTAIANKLNAEIAKIMNMPMIRDRIIKGGSEIVADSPEQFVATITAEQEIWTKVIREKDIKAD